MSQRERPRWFWNDDTESHEGLNEAVQASSCGDWVEVSENVTVRRFRAREFYDEEADEYRIEAEVIEDWGEPAEESSS